MNKKLVVGDPKKVRHGKFTPIIWDTCPKWEEFHFHFMQLFGNLHLVPIFIGAAPSRDPGRDQEVAPASHGPTGVTF